MHFLPVQDDGNFVLLRASNNEVLWSTGTAGSGAVKASMQADGNFVLTDAGGAEKSVALQFIITYEL
jgi:hypothetical protein